MDYTIPYEVEATTPFEALHKATDLLRTNVTIRKVEGIAPTVPGWYEVKLAVTETTADLPEYADDMTFAKWEADRV